MDPLPRYDFEHIKTYEKCLKRQEMTFLILFLSLHKYSCINININYMNN
jgi:hypothetical protein